MNKDRINEIKTLGQFYTKKNIAEEQIERLFNILNNLNLDKKTFLYIEPSAGKGDFLSVLKKFDLDIRAYDIQPKNHLIRKKDFLKTNIYFKSKKNKITIGNPPFGKRSKLAIDFFNKSAEYSDIIAFILPNQFKKYSTHSKLNKKFKLIKEFKIKDNAFYTDLQNDYNVNCVFQIWTKMETGLTDLRIKNVPEIKHDDFEIFQYNNTKEALKIFNNDFDFGVFSQGYGDYTKIYFKSEEMDKRKQWILFKAKNKKVLKRLKDIDFEKLSQDNTTVPGFRKGDVVKEYKRLYE